MQRESVRENAGQNLALTAYLAGHPSPRAEDSEQTGAHRGQPDTLNSCSKMAGHATPMVQDSANNAGPSQFNLNSEPLNVQVLGSATASTATSTAKTAGYRLNPAFSLWLMLGRMDYVASWTLAGMLASRKIKSRKRSTASRSTKAPKAW